MQGCIGSINVASSLALILWQINESSFGVMFICWILMHDEGGSPPRKVYLYNYWDVIIYFCVSPIKTDITAASEACLYSFQMAAGGEHQSRSWLGVNSTLWYYVQQLLDWERLMANFVWSLRGLEESESRGQLPRDQWHSEQGWYIQDSGLCGWNWPETVVETDTRNCRNCIFKPKWQSVSCGTILGVWLRQRRCRDTSKGKVTSPGLH